MCDVTELLQTSRPLIGSFTSFPREDQDMLGGKGPGHSSPARYYSYYDSLATISPKEDLTTPALLEILASYHMP